MMKESESDNDKDQFNINLLDTNYYKFPVFPVSANNSTSSDLNLFKQLFQFISQINWYKIYDNSVIHSELFKDNTLHTQLLQFTNSKLSHLDSIDQEVDNILKAEGSNPGNEQRRLELKKWLIKYFETENKINFPKFNSLWTLRIAYIIVVSILTRIYPEGIWCNQRQIDSVIRDRGIRLFLPSHKSHIDYIIIHIMCIRFETKIPAVIAGENLNVRFFGNQLAKLGAVFIKRNWFNYTDILVDNYSNVLQFLMEHNIDMELFIEGGRSRDGKLVVPKFGILQLIVNQALKTKQKITIYPLSIAYEKIYEFDSINDELMGNKPKAKESMMNILKHGYRNAIPNGDEKKNHGKVFLQFGETIDVLSSSQKVAELGLQVMNKIEAVAYITDIAVFNTAIYINFYDGTNTSARGTDKRQLLIHQIILQIDKICQTIIQSQSQSTPQSNIQRLLSMTTTTKTRYFIDSINKFNKNCLIDKQYLILKDERDLIMYKNNLIHFFIGKNLIARLILQFDQNEFYQLLKNMLDLFDTQFIYFHGFDLDKELNQLGIWRLDSITPSQRQQLQWFAELPFIDPFIESYLILSKLLAMNPDTILLNLSNTETKYQEAKNKAYAIQFLKKMNELEIYSKHQEQGQGLDTLKLRDQIKFLERFMIVNDRRLALKL